MPGAGQLLLPPTDGGGGTFIYVLTKACAADGFSTYYFVLTRGKTGGHLAHHSWPTAAATLYIETVVPLGAVTAIQLHFAAMVNHP